MSDDVIEVEYARQRIEDAKLHTWLGCMYRAIGKSVDEVALLFRPGSFAFECARFGWENLDASENFKQHEAAAIAEVTRLRAILMRAIDDQRLVEIMQDEIEWLPDAAEACGLTMEQVKRHHMTGEYDAGNG